MPQVQKYPLGWRVLHWLIALMVLVLIPVGLWMAERGEADLWDGLTNTLYGAHKAIGFSLLLLMVVRILVKLLCQRPPYPDNMPRRLRLAAQSVHTLLYALLILTPLLGWAGVTAYPALVVAGGYHLPAMPFVPENRDLAARLFELHGAFAITLGVLAAGHVAAAVRHMLRKDGIVRRML